jgi:NTP pyrophosphatase (non-canonical NTP hydrolase)
LLTDDRLFGLSTGSDRHPKQEESMSVITEKIPVCELLAGLAEESCELGQAALKLRRALDGLNPTDKPAIDADEDLQEEIADVLLYAWMCNIDTGLVAETIYKKSRRWCSRMKIDC